MKGYTCGQIFSHANSTCDYPDDTKGKPPISTRLQSAKFKSQVWKT